MHTIRFLSYAIAICLLLGLTACSKEKPTSVAQSASPAPVVAETTIPEPVTTPQRNVEESQAVVLLRGLPTLDTVHSVAIVEMDPEAENFGAILQEFEIPNMPAPLHHLYYSPTGRLYATGLDPACSLAEVGS